MRVGARLRRMGVLLLVRHGQASLGTADYDRLSDVGRRQAQVTGARLARTDLAVDRVVSGALTRQRDTAEAVLAAVEFADASPEPPLDTLYESLYVLDSAAGWYAVDERSPEPHRGEREDRMPAAARELAEAGAAYAGQPDGPRPNPAVNGDADLGSQPEVAAERDEDGD